MMTNILFLFVLFKPMKFPKIQSVRNNNLKVGDPVSVIDVAEDTTEWAVFIIRDFFNNRYRLSPVDRFRSYDKPFWVSPEEVIKVKL